MIPVNSVVRLETRTYPAQPSLGSTLKSRIFPLISFLCQLPDTHTEWAGLSSALRQVSFASGSGVRSLFILRCHWGERVCVPPSWLRFHSLYLLVILIVVGMHSKKPQVRGVSLGALVCFGLCFLKTELAGRAALSSANKCLAEWERSMPWK